MDDIEALVESIIKISPPMALMLALNAMLYFLRQTPIVPNWLASWIIVWSGAFIYPLISKPGLITADVPYPVVANGMTGFLIGFSAVGSHRTFQQAVQRFGLFQRMAGDRNKPDGSKE